jgi:hypothetical protein
MNLKSVKTSPALLDLPVDVLEYLSASPAIFKTVGSFENSKQAFSLSNAHQKAVELTVCEMLGAQYWIDFQMKSALSAGMSLAEILQIRIGISNEIKIEVLLNVTKSIVTNYQNITDKLFNDFISAGFIETEFLEVISLINQQKQLIELTYNWLMKSNKLNQKGYIKLNK